MTKLLRLIIAITFAPTYLLSETVTIYANQSAQYSANDCCTLNILTNQNSNSLYSQDCQDMGTYYGCGMSKNVPFWIFDLSILESSIDIQSVQFKGNLPTEAWSDVFLSTSSTTGQISTTIASDLWNGGNWTSGSGEYSSINWPMGNFNQSLPLEVVSQGVNSGQLNILTYTSNPWTIFSIVNSGDNAPRLVIDYEDIDMNCTAADGTEGVELWDECYSIENTTELYLSSFSMSGIVGDVLTGEIPSTIGDLVNLTSLSLRHQLSGEIPTEIGNLINLTTLDLSANQLSGEIPDEIGNLLNLTTLRLSDNQLSGEIPNEVDNLLNLTDLDISGNNLHGELRETLCNINYSSLGGNNFCPPYPECFDYTNIFPQNCENLICDNLSEGLWGWCFNVESTTNINAQYLNLSGEIPSEISNLTNLESLNLSNNNLIGEIPSEIFTLENLSNIYLNNNQLSGEIPSEFWTLSNVSYANLSYNLLEGQIPDEICNTFSNPENIILRGNQFCSGYPSCLNENNMFPQNCETTNCDEGSIGLWGGCFPVETTTEIQIYDNGLVASIPPEIGNLLNLSSLTLYTETTGSIPPEIGNLSNLNSLILNCNLSGAIPIEIGSLINLNRLDLYGNQLSQDIPNSVGELFSLNYLALNDNNLSGAIPTELGSLENLKNLYLQQNQLTGFLPVELGNMVNLENLDLSNNDLSGIIPTELGSLENLKNLYLQQNQLTGEIPSHISLIDSLYALNLSDNQLTGVIPSEFGNFGYLNQLELSHNQLNGSIPSELGSLENLRFLFLNDNQLTGEIPSELGNLTNLSGPYGFHGTAGGPGLDLSDNQLTGSFPSEIANLNELFGVLVYNNQLSGEIPQGVCNMGGGMGNTHFLGFGDNNFCPPYPECLTEAELGLQNTDNCEELTLSSLSSPKKYELHNAYPNPFNPITTLKYYLPEDSFVDITVYDMLGKIVNNLVKKNQNSGSKSVQWNATNNQGKTVSAGVYLYKIEAGEFSQTKKMILLK